MDGEVISVVADADLGKLSPRLLASGLRRMPITDDRGGLVGIVTRSDLMLWDHPPVARIDRVDRLMRRARRLVGAGAVRVDRDAQVRGGVTPNLAAHRLSPDPVRVRDRPRLRFSGGWSPG
jgi:CBS-domain-containing membrane protein